MKTYQPRRHSGPLRISIPGIALLALISWLIGWSYTLFYHENPLSRTELPHSWWVFVFPCLPAMWLLWVLTDAVITLCVRHKRLEVIDCEIDSEKESILIKIKPTHYKRLSEDNITARFEYIYHGGLPRCFKHQKTRYDESNDWYEVKIDASGLLKSIQIKTVSIYIKPVKRLPFHCSYLIHKFKYNWIKWLEDNRR